MNARQFAQIFGAVYLIVGILGFIPGVTQADPSYGSGGGMLFGLFPINYLHDVVHLVLGIWGVASAGSMARAVSFARGFAVILILLGICGFFPSVTSGIVPLGGYDTYLHLASGLVAAYFGWGAPSKAIA